ncbi:hypothetical protein JK182_09840 [Acetobacter okinawensis]|uniref:hypothetical protein n=1 Tax=Acetobacter okinawensis TaxID=1076594 RepID=UPI001BA9EFD7|nr:hypothetical protein [Acetobacter okinawensis]MBS0988961.1 hypothetical protein [Acetobacter okinawensis]
MSDKPTGVFVRLPLSNEQLGKLLAPIGTLNERMISIGTPVTGGELTCTGTIAWFEKDREPSLASYCPALFKAGDSVPVTSLPIAQAQIAALEAEVVRLRGGLEKAHLSAILGDVDPIADLECCRKHIEEALKGGAA